MLTWTLTFFLIALVAGIFSFTGVAAASVTIAQVLFFVFLVLFFISIVMGLLKGTDAIIDKGLR